jgi:Tfp pilus assembly protein FimV
VKDEQIARLQAAVRQQMEAQSSAPPAAPTPSAPAAAGGLFGFSWLVIGGAIGGLVLLGVIVLLVLRRLSGGSVDEDVEDFPQASVERSIDETQLMPALTAADLGGDDAADGDDGGEDVLAEADVYMAYGNFSEAAAALGAALEADPNRADIRLKLLEVHVEQGDVDAFNEQAFALQGIADEATIAEADRLAARLPGAASSSGEITSGDAAAPTREAR